MNVGENLNDDVFIAGLGAELESSQRAVSKSHVDGAVTLQNARRRFWPRFVTPVPLLVAIRPLTPPVHAHWIYG